MKVRNKKLSSKGFTIVELMIATAVFSVVLLITSAGVIAIGRSYYKSLTSTRVHETGRSVMEDVSRSLQFSKVDSIANLLQNMDGTPATIKVRCFGPDRYTYVINQQVTGGNHALYRDKRPSGSTCAPGGFTNGTELLGTNMRLLQFDVSNSNPFQITIKVAYGDDDLLTIYDDDRQPVGWSNPPTSVSDETVIAGALCRSGIAGSNFCAVAGLETTVTSRVE